MSFAMLGGKWHPVETGRMTLDEYLSYARSENYAEDLMAEMLSPFRPLGPTKEVAVEAPVPAQPDRNVVLSNYSEYQQIYKYDNGYGASVIRNTYSYGSNEGLYELAVLKHDEVNTDWPICYDTPITSDVIGYLTTEQVDELLGAIGLLTTEAF